MARVCVIRQQVAWSPRAAREVATLADAGHHVDLVCLWQPGTPWRERHDRVTTWRLRVPRGRGGLVGYLLEYGAFFLQAAVLVTALHLLRRYRLVQVNTLPDALVFAAVVPRVLGARVLLDLQEPMPEFFATKFGTGPRHPAVRLIAAVEQAAIGFAHHVITPTAQLRRAFAGRGAAPAKITVVMDGADETVFHPMPSLRPDPSRFTLISHGTIEERYGLDTAIDAVAQLRGEIPGLELRIYGEGSQLPALRAQAQRLGATDVVRFSAGFVPVDDLVAAIATADVGIVALKRDAFRDLTLAGKMFEFLAMRVPMAVAHTRSVDETFPPGCFETFDSGDSVGLSAALRRMHADAAHRARLAERAAAAAEPYRWVHQRERYLGVVGGLLRAGPVRSGDPMPGDEEPVAAPRR